VGDEFFPIIESKEASGSTPDDAFFRIASRSI
jgi:hypothetical protein